jgi:hypothetical protein
MVVLGSMSFVKFRNYELKLPSFEFAFSLVSIEFAYQGLVLVFQPMFPSCNGMWHFLLTCRRFPQGIRSNAWFTPSARSLIEHDGVLVSQI